MRQPVRRMIAGLVAALAMLVLSAGPAFAAGSVVDQAGILDATRLQQAAAGLQGVDVVFVALDDSGGNLDRTLVERGGAVGFPWIAGGSQHCGPGGQRPGQSTGRLLRSRPDAR